MATKRELLGALNFAGQGFSKMQENIRTAKSFEAEQERLKAEQEYLSKFRPMTLTKTQQDIDIGGIQKQDEQMKLEQSRKLVAANEELAKAVGGEWGFLSPEEKANEASWRAELNALNRSGKATLSPQEFVLGKRMTMAEEGRKKSKAESELETDKAQRALFGASTLAKQAEMNRPAKPGDLPLDVKSEVAALSSKNAGKISIANQIGAYLKEFKEAKSADDKARIGGQMLKVLNSPEGADAIGVEEAKRLGDALEYNLFDIKAGIGAKPGKLIGRDLDGFERQVQATYDAITGSVKSNREEVGRLLNKPTQAPPSDRKSLAQQALNDPEATEAEKAQARRILGL